MQFCQALPSSPPCNHFHYFDAGYHISHSITIFFITMRAIRCVRRILAVLPVEMSPVLLLLAESAGNSSLCLYFSLQLLQICPRTWDANSFAPNVIELRKPPAPMLLKSLTKRGDKIKYSNGLRSQISPVSGEMLEWHTLAVDTTYSNNQESHQERIHYKVLHNNYNKEFLQVDLPLQSTEQSIGGLHVYNQTWVQICYLYMRLKSTSSAKPHGNYRKLT